MILPSSAVERVFYLHPTSERGLTFGKVEEKKRIFKVSGTVIRTLPAPVFQTPLATDIVQTLLKLQINFS
jgi:hypothetical protein